MGKLSQVSHQLLRQKSKTKKSKLKGVETFKKSFKKRFVKSCRQKSPRVKVANRPQLAGWLFCCQISIVSSFLDLFEFDQPWFDKISNLSKIQDHGQDIVTWWISAFCLEQFNVFPLINKFLCAETLKAWENLKLKNVHEFLNWYRLKDYDSNLLVVRGVIYKTKKEFLRDMQNIFNHLSFSSLQTSKCIFIVSKLASKKMSMIQKCIT